MRTPEEFRAHILDILDVMARQPERPTLDAIEPPEPDIDEEYLSWKRSD